LGKTNRFAINSVVAHIEILQQCIPAWILIHMLAISTFALHPLCINLMKIAGNNFADIVKGNPEEKTKQLNNELA